MQMETTSNLRMCAQAVGMPMHPIIMHGRKEEAETEAEKKKA
jgi:hypothetical protein